MSPEDNAKIKAIEVETPEQVAERVAGEAPEPGSEERERAVRSHVERVAEMAKQTNGKTPDEIERILRMPHPECDCDNPSPKSAHKTVICTNCGGICVGAASEKMQEVVADAIRQRSDATPNPDDYPTDSLGRKPVLFNKGAKTPIKCMRCEAEGNLVYAGYAQRSRKIFCPTGRHTKIPNEAKFTNRFMRRKKAKRAKT